VNVIAPEKVVAKRNTTQSLDLTVQVKQGFHVNSTTPSDEYLIPLRLTFTDSPVKVADIVFPKPKMQTFEFATKPMSVYEGDIRATAKLKIPATVPAGPQTITGKLRYQACNDRMCLPPRTLDIKVPVEIRN
jgi:DsbC/DsbD-like thiol-disulfide interchange protein